MKVFLRNMLERAGFRDGLCLQFMRAADDLILSARELRSDLEKHKKAQHPFDNLLSTMYNNHEFQKFPEKRDR